MIRNSAERWGSVQIGLHWLVAALIVLVQVPAGLIMVFSSPGPLQDTLYTLHKNVGLIIFILAVARLLWRWSNPVPVLPDDMPLWQARLARTTHALLYVLLFLLPISGFLFTALGGFPVPFLFFGDIGKLLPVNKPASAVFETIHVGSTFALYLVAALHVAGALQHRLVRKDGILTRMMSSRAPLAPVVTRAAREHAPTRG